MPVFDMLERMMMKRLNFPPGVALRLVARSAYVGEITFLCINHRVLDQCVFDQLTHLPLIIMCV